MDVTPEEHFAEAVEEGLVEKLEDEWVLTDAGRERLSEDDVKRGLFRAVDVLSEESGIPGALVTSLMVSYGMQIFDAADREDSLHRTERKMDSLLPLGMVECRVDEDGKKVYRLTDQGWEIGGILTQIWEFLEEAVDGMTREKYGLSREQAHALQALAAKADEEEGE